MIYLNEQNVYSVTDAADVADEFVLMHKTVFSPYTALECMRVHLKMFLLS